MISLVLAMAFFLAIHFGIAGTRVRDALVGRLGEQPYLGVFSLASIAGLAWMILAYASAPFLDVWGQRYELRWLALGTTFVAFQLVVLGLTTPTATTAGADRLIHEPVRGIARVTRHPFLWGVALWALTHLAVNGDAASLVLFGGLALLAIGGPFSIDRRKARLLGPDWKPFAEQTSAVPFVAIAQGRNRLVLGEIGAWRIALATAVYAVALYFHSSVFGGAPLPG